jgi:hypothetical protein
MPTIVPFRTLQVYSVQTMAAPLPFGVDYSYHCQPVLPVQYQFLSVREKQPVRRLLP